MWVVTEKSIGTFCGIFFNRYTFWRKLKPCLITWTVDVFVQSMLKPKTCFNHAFVDRGLNWFDIFVLSTLSLLHNNCWWFPLQVFHVQFFSSRASCLAFFSYKFWSNLHHSFSIAGGKFPQKYVLKGVEKCAQVWKAKFGVDLKSNINSDGEVGRGASLFIN